MSYNPGPPPKDTLLFRIYDRLRELHAVNKALDAQYSKICDDNPGWFYNGWEKPAPGYGWLRPFEWDAIDAEVDRIWGKKKENEREVKLLKAQLERKKGEPETESKEWQEWLEVMFCFVP